MPEGDKFKDLVVRAQAGDQQAFGEIYSHYLNPIFRFIRGLGIGADDAPDLVQEVFLKAWSKISQYQDRGFNFSAWLYTLARHTALDWFKKKKPAVLDDPEAFFATLASPVADPEAVAIQAADRRLTEWGLAGLGHADREVLVLHYISDLSHSEIAQILNLSEEAVRQRKSRALKALREIITQKIANYGQT